MTYTNNLHHAYQFGPYLLDFSKRILTRSDEIISLAPKATEILMMLVANAGELVEKDDLLKEVWPDTFVEEANLTQNIFTLRRALGDERANPRYIETVARRGYRFIAPVRNFGPNEQEATDFDAKESASHQPVIAVLPFLNTTGDPELEYLAEGITENVINKLSRVSELRVISRSTALRYKAKDIDPQQVGKELRAHTVLVGKINAQTSVVTINVELVDVRTGWQLWGEGFDSNKDIFEIQDAITRQLLTTLKLKLNGAGQKRVTARYTESGQAYQAYLEGRYQWSRFSRKGMKKAIRHFRHATELDPNYALAYAGIVDCNLRVVTNYLPAEGNPVRASINLNTHGNFSQRGESNQPVKLRFEWDWKGAERELRRAHELKADYPAAHQWYAALRFSQRLLEEAQASHVLNSPSVLVQTKPLKRSLPMHIPSIELTPNEQVQVYCAIAREQIDVGNYDAACMILGPWWQLGNWPKLEGLNQQSCADLLFTTGELAGCVASTNQLPKGQKYGEALLSGSIALWEQLGSGIRAAEGRIELAHCYYRQGLFDLGRSTLVAVLNNLSAEQNDLRSLALIRLASLERHAGRLRDALALLTEAAAIVDLSGPWVRGRCHLEFASTYKDLSVAYEVEDYFQPSREFYSKALYEFEAVGNHRLAAIVENNLGYLLLIMKEYSESEFHLLRAQRSFDCFHDKIRRAQAEDSLARLYLVQRKFEEAEKMIDRAIQTMEVGDEDALLAEALTTKGMIYCRSDRHIEAKRVLEDAHRLASRCGDQEGAGRALLVLMEEVCEHVESEECKAVGARLVKLLASSQQPSILRRLRKCLEHSSHQPDMT